jgi:hypothetical protein
MSGIARHHSEWLSLIEVSGPFLTLPVLVRVFPQGLPKVDGNKLGRLRAAYEEWANAQDVKAPDASALHATWVQLVLGELLEFDDQTLRSGDGLPSGLDVPLAEHHETLRPSIAIVEPSGRAKAGKPRLLVAVWPSDQDLESAVPAARWAASPLERMTQLCRSAGVRLGLVTNGERWTVVDAPVGQTAGYASWYAGLWLQEPITLAAFEALLGVRRFFAVADTDTIEALLDESVAFQQEVTDQLGYQVRRAVEVLVQALDRADLDRNRELLRDVPPARLYDAALTVMMRLVFLFCAEERGLLLLGDETYDANYAVSTLRALLREEADRVGVEVLERRQDAWARLLATFRAVHGGVEHEALRLPALGGSLFDPDRFPFLEGRAAGTSWLATTASPLPIDNRTVLHLLEALQLLRTRGDGGSSEARKLSYRALDIEQIGHVYEGLLDHVAVRVDADTLGLLGTKDKEPELSLDELNRERHHGVDGLIAFLKERTGRSSSALRNDLDAELDEVAEQRLLVACGNDKALVKRIAPYHALIRKDVWGYPQIYRAGSFMVTGGPERRQTGTHYTPKSLTEQIVTETLEPLVYVGPAEGKSRDAWKLRSASELLDLKICDMAMGSGAFLVQVCRWLAERVVEAWEEAERQGAAISADGDVLEKAAGHDLLPLDREERLSFARRLVAERCVYGVDINPMAVELAKLSLWLVTLAKGRPFGFLDHNLRSGDSLLGIHRLDQLTELSMTPAGGGQRRLFGKSIESAVHEALALRRQLRVIAIRDIHDVQAMAALDASARAKIDVAERLADGFVGAVFAADSPASLETRLSALSIEAERIVYGDAATLKSSQDQATWDLAKDLPPGRPVRRPFHWSLELPEVFARENAGFDGIVGNPPFLGGKRISTVLGPTYNDWLATAHEGASKNADLVAHFFRRAWNLLRDGGGFGLLATNSIAEGDTRQSGLEWLLRHGAVIHSAHPNEPWPGSAAVVTSRVHVRRGEWQGKRSLLGRPVPYISAFLSDREEWSPKRLKANAGIGFIGSLLNGIGFVLAPDEAERMLDSDPKNADVLFPYLNGEDLNSDPEQQPRRFVINFWDWSEQRAREYALPYRRVLDRVKPHRDTINDAKKRVKERWWTYEAVAFDLYHRIGTGHRFERHPEGWDPATGPMMRVLALTRVSKTLAFSFVPSGCVFSEQTVVFAIEDSAQFAILQSSIHAAFAWQHASRMKNDLRYSPTDAFEPFPWPDKAVPEALESLGDRFHEARRSVMSAERIGLTKLYNRFHDPNERDSRIEALRELHREIDITVARAYNWDDIDLGHGFHEVPYLPENDHVRFTISETGRVEVLQRLAELNRIRYEEEGAQALLRGTATRIHRPRRADANTAPQPLLVFSGRSENQAEHLMAAEPRARCGADPGRAIVDFLKTHFDWHAKSAILAATGLTDGQWNSAITDLVANGLVERQGERRGARYRSRSGPHGARGARP